jgi:hypothetical protein
VQVDVVMHEPPVQVPAQITPQPPQLLLSLPIVSTHELEQQLSLPHGVPQPPQLFGSLVVSTHMLLQHVLAMPRQAPPHGVVFTSGEVYWS